MIIPNPKYDTLVSPELPNNVNKLTFACPVCGYVRSSDDYSETMVGFFSPKGHDHDDNCRKFRFRCKDSHGYIVRVRNTCPTEGCNWKGKENCNTCGANVRVIQL
jgi:hypothetical protein